MTTVGGRAAVSPRSRTGRVVTGVVFTVLALGAVFVAVVAAGALVPALGPVADLATLGIPAYGPRLVLLGLVVVLGAALLRRRARRAAAAVAAVALVATVVLAVAVGAIVTTTTRAGGSVDLRVP